MLNIFHEWLLPCVVLLLKKEIYGRNVTVKECNSRVHTLDKELQTMGDSWEGDQPLPGMSPLDGCPIQSGQAQTTYT